MKRKTGVILLLMILTIPFLWGIMDQDIKAADMANYVIYVDRKSNIVNVVNKKTKKLVRSMYCSTGKRNSTIKGTFKTIERLRWHELYGNVYGQYCVRFKGAYLFHSVPYYRVKNNMVETKEYNKLSKQASKGCVRLAVVDCKWIYDHCKLGTKVVVGDNLKLEKPVRKLLKISTAKKSGWDPTDPNKKNPYYPTLKLKSNSYKTLTVGSIFHPYGILNVSSKFSTRKELLANTHYVGKVDTSKVGSYKITYTMTDPATLLKKTLSVSFKVVEDSTDTKE